MCVTILPLHLCSPEPGPRLLLESHNHSHTTTVITRAMALIALEGNFVPTYTWRSPRSLTESTRGKELPESGKKMKDLSHRPNLHQLEREGPLKHRPHLHPLKEEMGRKQCKNTFSNIKKNMALPEPNKPTLGRPEHPIPKEAEKKMTLNETF